MNGFVRALLLLILAAPAARAQSTPDQEDAAAKPAETQVDELRGKVGRPEDFQSFVEGSIAHQGGPSGTLESARPSPSSLPPLSAPRGELSRRPQAPPAPLNDWADRSQKEDHSLPLAQGLGVLGLTGILLGALAAGEPAVQTRRIAAPARPAPQISAPAPQPAPEPSPLQAEPAAQEPAAVFVDTRMPVSTWRAISLREQQLIDQWDRSPEKARGAASLTQWLGAQGRTDGVDVARLIAKLERDA